MTVRDETAQTRRETGAWSREGGKQIPKETLTPMVPLTIEHHITGGFGYRFTQR